MLPMNVFGNPPIHFPPLTETWRQVWGRRTKFSNDVLAKNFDFTIDNFLRPFKAYIYSPFIDQNLDFTTKNSSLIPFLVSSWFASHPITALLKILGDECMGRPLNFTFWEYRPPSPPYVSAHD